MKSKSIMLVSMLAMLCACDSKESATQNPEVLKGAEFIAITGGVDIVLNFDANDMRVYGKVVNSYNGGYEASGDKIKFAPFASTMMFGPEDAMADEAEYFKFMTTVEKYELADSKLTLYGAEDKTVVFQKVEPAAAPDAE